MDERIPGVISSIMMGNNTSFPVRTSGNLRYLKNQELGTPYVQMFYNPSLDQYGFRDTFLERLRDENQTFGETLVIDKKMMEDDEVFNAIREKAIKQGKPTLIRIADEGYKVTREDYNKLSFVSHIAADDCVEELSSVVLTQNKTFKLDSQKDAQPVLERRKQFDELVSRNVFHINHKLTEEEFNYLVNCMNQVENASIELDMFDPDYYEEFLEKLQAHNVKANTNIQLVGYLLQDQLDVYKRLEKFPFEIDVVYSTCHDMIDMYTKEPYTGNRLYYSQVEGGGKTSLGNYLNVLEEVSNFEALARSGNYSPLEIAILAKIKIDSDYIYDPDFMDIDTDFWDNVNLSQMIHHEENGKKRAVCVGFATLFSAYCRRCGVPMFRYSTRGHMRSIGRIHDEKYGVDTVGTADITWDLPDQNGFTHSYKYFMGSPRDFTHHQDQSGKHEFLTIPDIYSLPYEYMVLLAEQCKDPVESFYSQVMYSPTGYAARLLELMGLVPEQGPFDLYDKIYSLCSNGNFEGIPEETLYAAITNVLHSLGWSDERIGSYLDEVRNNAQYKQMTLNHPPAIGTREGDTNIPVELITPQNVQGYRDRLWNSGITRPMYERTPDEPTPTEEEKVEPTIPPTIKEEETQELDYVHKVIKYCREQNISVYNYYRNIGNMYKGNPYEPIPDFERENPFLTNEDPNRVRQSEEELIVHYFAHAMAQTIRLNLTKEESTQYSGLFSKEDNTYVDSLKEEMKERIDEKEEFGKEHAPKTPPTPKEEQTEATNTQEPVENYNPDDYCEEMIPGTNIHRPRYRGVYESDEDYVEFLRDFYRRHFPNAEYVQAVLEYCQENDVNIYDYYVIVGEQRRANKVESLPEFEQENPFLSDGDNETLQTSEDDMIITYFANAMMKTIGLNISDFKRDQLQEMFSDEVENYNEEIARRQMI